MYISHSLEFINGGFFLILQVKHVFLGVIFTFKGTLIPESSQTFATFKE